MRCSCSSAVALLRRQGQFISSEICAPACVRACTAQHTSTYSMQFRQYQVRGNSIRLTCKRTNSPRDISFDFLQGCKIVFLPNICMRKQNVQKDTHKFVLIFWHFGTYFLCNIIISSYAPGNKKHHFRIVPLYFRTCSSLSNFTCISPTNILLWCHGTNYSIDISSLVATICFLVICFFYKHVQH
jgi:hypothetical protein